MSCCDSCAHSHTHSDSPVKGLCTPVKQMYATATQEKSQMQDLNNVLAAYLDRVRQMRAQAGGSLDPRAYKDAMKVLEDEMMNLKNMYENELGRLRALVDQANKEKGDLMANIGSCNNMASGLKNRLDMEVTGNQKILQDIAALQRALADREKEIANLKGCVNSYESELGLLRPQLKQALQDCDELRKRLAMEQSMRIAAEDKLKHLCDKLNFDSNAMAQENRDLKEKLRALNDIIASLEGKIQQLSQADGGSTSCLLQKLREGTNAELRKYKDEAERVLNKAIQSMRSQRDEDMRSKDSLMKEKLSLENLVNQLQGRLADLEGQLAACKQQNHALEQALRCERDSCQTNIRGLEKKLGDLNDQVLAKATDMSNAREAQVSLQAEINTYKTLLDQDRESRLPEIKQTNYGVTTQQKCVQYVRPTVMEKRYENYRAPNKYEMNVVRSSNPSCLGNYSSNGNMYKSTSNYMSYAPPDMKMMNRHSYGCFK